MSAPENKPFTNFDYQQTLRKSYNDTNATIGVDGFVVGKVGNTITKANTSATVETYSFYQDYTTLLYQITITYVDSTKNDFVSVVRTA